MPLPSLRREVVAAIAFAVAQGPRAAGAAPATPDIVVTRHDGADDCPDRAALAVLVTRLATASQSEHSAVLIHVDFSRWHNGYRAEIRTYGPTEGAGTRLLEDVGPRCASLAEAVGVTLAMLLDTPAAPPASCPPPQPSPPLAPQAQLQAEGLRLELGAGASVGVLEHPAPMLSVGVDGSIGARTWLAGGVLYFVRDRVVGEGGEVALDLYGAWGRLCAVAAGRPDAVALRACFEPQVGLLQGIGRAYVEPKTQRTVWFALTAGPLVDGALGGWGRWWSQLLLVVPVRRTGFSIEQPGSPVDIFRTPSVGGVLSLGAEVAL